MAFVLGVTGGIGTGKSTVTRMFADLGAQTISADEIARDVLAKGAPAYEEAVGRFGRGILAPDGEIDRPALAGVIFADEKARTDLDAISHPRIISEINERIRRFRCAHAEDRSVLVVEIPLLIECGLEETVDEVLVVAAEQATQVSRLTSRSGISKEDALRRIAAQMPIKTKIERADRVIWNDLSMESLRESVARIWEEIFLL